MLYGSRLSLRGGIIHCSYVFSDDEFGERSVGVVLDNVESELIFIDHTNGEMSVSG